MTLRSTLFILFVTLTLSVFSTTVFADQPTHADDPAAPNLEASDKGREITERILYNDPTISEEQKPFTFGIAPEVFFVKTTAINGRSDGSAEYDYKDGVMYGASAFFGYQDWTFFLSYRYGNFDHHVWTNNAMGYTKYETSNNEDRYEWEFKGRYIFRDLFTDTWADFMYLYTIFGINYTGIDITSNMITSNYIFTSSGDRTTKWHEDWVSPFVGIGVAIPIASWVGIRADFAGGPSWIWRKYEEDGNPALNRDGNLGYSLYGNLMGYVAFTDWLSLQAGIRGHRMEGNYVDLNASVGAYAMIGVNFSW